MTLLNESIRNHQELVNLLIAYRNEKGVCSLSQAEMAKKLNKCPNWISQAIKRLNREKVCIEKNKEGYLVNFEDVTAQGTFFQIIQTIHYFSENPEEFNANEIDIAKKLNIKRKTLQAAKAYLRNS